MGPLLVHRRNHGKGCLKLPRAGFLLGGMQVFVGRTQVSVGGTQVSMGGMQASMGRTQVAMRAGCRRVPKSSSPPSRSLFQAMLGSAM